MDSDRHCIYHGNWNICSGTYKCISHKEKKKSIVNISDKFPLKKKYLCFVEIERPFDCQRKKCGYTFERRNYWKKRWMKTSDWFMCLVCITVGEMPSCHALHGNIQAARAATKPWSNRLHTRRSLWGLLRSWRAESDTDRCLCITFFYVCVYPGGRVASQKIGTMTTASELHILPQSIHFHQSDRLATRKSVNQAAECAFWSVAQGYSRVLCDKRSFKIRGLLHSWEEIGER